MGIQSRQTGNRAARRPAHGAEVFAELQQRLESTGYRLTNIFCLTANGQTAKEIPKDAGFFLYR